MSFKTKSTMLLASVIIAIVGMAPRSYAQAIDGNLAGSVLDSTGASVPNASVELENIATGVKYTARTGVEGSYRFNNLPVGRYNLTVKATGFGDSGLKNLVVDLNRTATGNVTVQVQGVTQEIAVIEAPAAIDTTTSQLQSTFKADQIVSLPIIETAGLFYGALNLSLLSAGVASSGGVGQGTGPSVGGQRPMNNNFMIEGVDNNNKTVTGPLVYVPTDATAEFSLLQNQYSSEFGHSTGGQFNSVVKSGDNTVHGSLYEYFQNRNLNAIDQQNKRQGFTKNPRYDQNRVGGSVGGPIIQRKWFYFGNFEYAPLGQAFTLTPPVSAPTAAGYALLDAQPALNALGTTGVSKPLLGVLKQYVPPAPVQNGTSLVNGVAIPIGILPVAGAYYTNQYAVVGSSDYNFSDRDQLRGRFVYNRIDDLDNDGNLPAFWTNLPQRFFLGTAALYHTFSPTLTNETRLGFNRFSQFYVVPDFKFPALDVFPNLVIDDLGLQIGPNSSAPQYSVQNTYQLVDNLSWNKGAHSFKFGFDGRDVIAPSQFVQRERGDYDYSKLEEYLTDQIPPFAERNLGSAAYYGNQWATYLYAQDDWHIRRNLTMNLGVRWERTTVSLGMKQQALNAISSVPGFLDFREPKTSNKSFAPRLGLAYSPGTKGTTSIRAGFGLAYDVIFDNVGSTAYPPQLSATVDAGDNKDLFKAPFLANGGIRPGSIAVGGNLSQKDARAATSSYIPDQVLPYSIQWTLGVQHEFARDYTLETRYVGTRGVHLLAQGQMLRVAPVQPDRSLPTYLTAPSQATLDSLPLTLTQLQAVETNPILGPLGFTSRITWFPAVGNSFYHSWATQLTRRVSNGLQFVGAYTWSHNIDDSTATHFTTVLTPRRQQDFLNLSRDKSSSALDRRHRLTFSWVYDSQWLKGSSSWLTRNLLGNWGWVGTYTYESPEFVTPQSGIDSNLNGDNAGDRTVLNPAGDPTKGSDIKALTNTSGAIVAYVAQDPSAMYIKAGLGAYPNAGRNTLKTRPIDNFDMSFSKKFTIREGQTIQFRGDFSNIFNHPQYTPGYLNSVKITPSSRTNTRDFMFPDITRFGKWDEVFASNARTVSLALRFIF